MRRPGNRRRADWRRYQRHLKVRAFLGRLGRRLPFLLLCAGGGFSVLILIVVGVARFSERTPMAGYGPPAGRKAELPVRPLDLHAVIARIGPDPARLLDTRTITWQQARLTLRSSLDADLQTYAQHLLERSKTVQAAIVVLRPRDGAVLAMATYQDGEYSGNLCLRADFPAASLFKIVTAAAALEWAGLEPDQELAYRGRKYTLYKGQLTDKAVKGANRTTFRKAFATSINPVFGKLGIYDLGQRVLLQYAERFMFNREIPFDFPLPESRIQVPGDAFGLAEIASGFNKRTLISPLHAALLVAAVANDGLLMAPWVVEKVVDEQGRVRFERKPVIIGSPISEETARSLRLMMRDTLRYGTGKKSFQRLRGRPAFKGIDMGGKTGTINDRSDQHKVDWFSAYVLPAGGSGGISLAVVGVHGKKLGIRAHELGRLVIERYVKSGAGNHTLS